MKILINDLRRHTDALRPELDEACRRVLDRGWFVLGPEVDAFERAFAAWCGVSHAIGVANGTDALQLGLQAVGVKPGSRVAAVANAGMYGTAALTALGATPVYVDVDPRTLLMDTEDLKRKLDAARVDAIIVTHLYGRLAAIEQIVGLAQQHGVPVVEDCAQSHGAQREGQRAGSFADVGCFSFYPTKNLGAIGDGGAVVTSDQRLAGRLRQLRQYGWSAKYDAALSGGRNSRLDELQAAVLSAKLPKLDRWNERRREIAQAYIAGIDNPRLRCPPVGTPSESVWHLFVVRVAAEERADLRRHLEAVGIGCDVHYPIPDHQQVACRGLWHGHLPVTEAASGEVLTLPCFPELADDEVRLVIEAVNAW